MSDYFVLIDNFGPFGIVMQMFLLFHSMKFVCFAISNWCAKNLSSQNSIEITNGTKEREKRLSRNDIGISQYFYYSFSIDKSDESKRQKLSECENVCIACERYE